MKKALELKKDLYWVGALDPDIRIFDIIMHADYGTTYNSYVLKGEKTALIEVAKESFYDEFLERLKEIMDPAGLDYIVVNHTEPDHTGCLEKLLTLCPDVQVVGSATAIKFLRNIVNRDFKAVEVKDGDVLDLGGKTLKFMAAPFLHWPDSMYTWVEEVKALFTCDSFGCHYSLDKVLVEHLPAKDQEGYIKEYRYYYDCLMAPFTKFVLQAVNKIEGLDIEMICPGHGPVLNKDVQKYIGLYKTWASEPPKPGTRIVIAYVSNYGYTKKLAEKVAEGLQAAGDIQVSTFNLALEPIDQALAAVGQAQGLLVGTPTLLGDTLPPVWQFMSSLNPVVHKGILAGAFGSYGWSGEAVPNVENRFCQLRLKMPVKSYRTVFNPSDAELAEAVAFGKEFGQQVLAKTK